MYCSNFSDYINDDFCIPSVLFDEAHRKSLNDAVSLYQSKRFLTQKARTQLVKEINVKKNENIRKRKKFIIIYGQSIKIRNKNEINYLESTVTSVIIEKGACSTLTSFDINECQSLKQLTIRDNNFKNISSFSIQNLPDLVSITIGNNCFAVDNGRSKNGSFTISNCTSLEVLEIGKQSFKDYGSFSLTRLNCLRKLVIGGVYDNSSNFLNCNRFSLSGK